MSSEELNFLVLLGAIEHDLGSTELIAAMNQRHLGGEAGEEDRLFHGGVAAANHGNLLAGKKEAVAGRAGRNAVSDQCLFAGQSQPARRGSAGDDQGAGVNGFLAQIQGKRAFAQIGADHVAKLILRPEAGRLLAHVLDQLGTLNALGKAGEILHQRGQRELASGFVTFEHQRLQVGAGGVERGGVTGAAGPDNDNVADVLHKIGSRKLRQALDCRNRIWMQPPEPAPR